MGSMEHPLSSLSVEGSLRADGGSYQDSSSKAYAVFDSFSGGLGGGSGGTVLLFMGTLTIGDNATLSSVGGNGGPLGGGGGAGGRVHFHWSEIPSGDLYQPIARVGGRIATGFVLASWLHLFFCMHLYYRKRFRSACSVLLLYCFVL